MKLKHVLFALFTFFVLTSCEEKVAITGIAVDPTTLTLTEVGQTDTLTVTLAPANAKEDIVWASSNTAVATVAGDGVTAIVTAVGKGTVKITATADNIFTAECTVVVNIGSSGGGEGNGSAESPYNVAQVLAFFDESGTLPSSVWANGYIVGGIIYDPVTPGGTDYTTTSIDGAEDVVFGTNVRNTAVLIADSKDETDYTKCVVINLPSGNIRNVVNLKDNAANLKKLLTVKGNVARYFAVPGVRDLTDFILEGYVPPVVPGTPNYTTKFLDETLLTQTSFDKFTAVSVAGAETWKFDSKYGAVMSGYTSGASHANEDWLISPVINLSGQSNVLMSFDHARGPAGSITVGVQEGWYKVYATANYTDVASSTWVEVVGVYHGTTAWGFVSSGGLTIPSSAISATTRVAFKYVCSDAASATWEFKNLIVGK